MELKSYDNLEQAIDHIKGLLDIMHYMETARQDVLIPIAILTPFETVLEKVDILLRDVKETEEKESTRGI